MKIRENADRILEDLFEVYCSREDAMPMEWAQQRKIADKKGDAGKVVRVVCDFIAGMTDRFAVQEHQRLFDETPELA